jgi:DNA helicase II / ATP-dependent DNA helicase PcrA
VQSNSNATGTIEEIGRRDHEVTSEYRIYGPPGCGKTTSLTRQIRRAVDRFGADSVLVTSFSRAAAAELAGRDLPIAGDRVGTLHSHCYHALGGPEIAEANVEEWNRDNPEMAITAVKKHGKLDGEETGEEDDSGLAKDGDGFLQQVSRFRGMQLPERAWSPNLREFARLWTEYKQANGLMDFTDLIETCTRDVALAPKNPSVIFADEAQDLNKLQLALIRKWGERAEYFIVAGDDDQTIYSFTGAQPEAILHPDIPDDHKIVLKQSYRVPRAVHALAEKTIRQVTIRQEKVYLPRPEEGHVSKLVNGGYNSPEYGILKGAEEHIERGQTVMFLAPCSYMLKPLIQVLRKSGIPFHNPYRKSNGFWNPLRLGRRGSTPNRILALLVGHPVFGDYHRPWTRGDVALWAEWLVSKGILRHGAKKSLQQADCDSQAGIEYLDMVFETGALESLMDAWDGDHRRLLAWWRDRLTIDAVKRSEFPAGIAAKYGPQALLDPPKIVLGTIHSVKGGQADVVFLFPDLSRAGDEQYQKMGAPRDSVVRLFYVGITRARDALYICQPESHRAVSI